jgi:3-hydroxyisobutyrate dehydrogenase
LDCKTGARAIRGGAAGSWVLDNRAGNMVDNQYPLGFRVRLHHKDLKIALEAARELGVSMPATALVDQVETGLVGRGYGDEDVSAVARTIRELSGIL